MKGIITIPLFRRPGYTKRVLDALAAQPEIKDFFCHFQADGCQKDVIEQAIDFNATRKHITINGDNYGCTANLYAALDNARLFAVAYQTDLIICVEDDCLPGKDFLQYMLYAKQFLSEKNASISGYHKYEDCPADLYSTVHFQPRWCAWGWGTNLQHLTNALQTWDWSHPASWDLMLAQNYFWQRKTIMPYLSRVQNIGAYNGTYEVDPEHHEREVMVHHWVNAVDHSLLGEYVFREETLLSELPMWDNHPLRDTLILRK